MWYICSCLLATSELAVVQLAWSSQSRVQTLDHSVKERASGKSRTNTYANLDDLNGFFSQTFSWGSIYYTCVSSVTRFPWDISMSMYV